MLTLTMMLVAWEATTETTNATNIFIPIGEMIPKADYVTIKIIINVTNIFDETREVCHLSDAIKELMEKRQKIFPLQTKKFLTW